MDYEKAYKDALERAKKFAIDDAYASQGVVAKLIFPELSESEDERIRKGLIEALKTSKTVGELKFVLPEPTREECLAWLEKQKEPHYTKRNALFDKYVAECDPAVMKEVSDKVDEMLGKEQKPRWEINNPHTTKWTREMIDEKFEELVEPKPTEWSEEDEGMLKWIEDILLIADNDLSDKLNGRVSPITDSAYSSMKLCIAKCLSWLKSLRPCPSWKPSEEQLNALNFAITYFMHETNYKNPTELRELYEQLKKL